MVAKFGVKQQMFTIKKYSNCKIEPFVLFPFLTSVLIATPFMLASTSSSWKIKLYYKIVCLFIMH